MYRILIVEDDSTISEQIGKFLGKWGHETACVTDFENILPQFVAFDPHLVLLDIGLPEMDGFALCSRIRAVSSTPVIFVTGQNTDMDELNSILSGGDAFITKPYHTAILLARISALLLRAYGSAQSETLTWKDAALHLEGSFIEYEGRRAELTKNEVKILYYLFKHAGTICPRNDIIDFLWESELYVDDNALSVNITRIRNKLADIGLPDFITTKHRQGYLLKE